ncbi:Glutathione amide reductase [Commensalibacter sp. Nvir]|nr:Glutathione amide reductase [Commensalibacter sp. Nvir]
MNMVYDYDLLVIGAGSGGVRCARIAAEQGAKVAIVEKQHWGGTCVNIGCVPKKLMMMASGFGDEAKLSQGFGWSNQRGEHHWKALIEAKNNEVERLNQVYLSTLRKAGVHIYTGSASFKDPHTLQICKSSLSPEYFETKCVSSERIVIATGSLPTLPDIEGNTLGITSDQAFYLSERPKRVLIVGAGYIGIEFSGIFKGLGSTVDLVYRQKLPLRGFDEDLRQALYDGITQRGITQHNECKPLNVLKRADKYIVHLDNGKKIETDCVFFATGRHPNSKGLNLSTVGVNLSSKGQIFVNNEFETNVPHIYAIGDVIDKINLTPVAIAQGHALAERLFAGSQRHNAYAMTPKAVFFYPPLSSTGLTEEEAVKEGEIEIYQTQFTPMRFAFSSSKFKTFIKMIVDKKTQKVIGLHIMGIDAPEMMQGFAVAIAAGLTKYGFDQTIGIHPSSAEELVSLRQITRVAKKV